MQLTVIQLIVVVLGAGIGSGLAALFSATPSRTRYLWAALTGAWWSVVIQMVLILCAIFIGHYMVLYSEPSVAFLVLYLIAALIGGSIVVLCSAALRGHIALVRAPRDTSKHPWLRWVGGIACALLSFVASVLFFLPRWIMAWYGTISGEQLLFTLTAGGGGTTVEVQNEITLYIIVPVVCITLLSASVCLLHHDLVLSGTHKALRARTVRRLSVPVALLAVLGAGFYAWHTLPMGEIWNANLTASDYIERNYVAPSSETVQFRGPKRNLIHIYMESVEASYFDRAHGGYMPVNLMPELLELSKEGTSFSHTTTMGGPNQTHGSEHSVAAMTNFWAGVPLKYQVRSSDQYDFVYPKFLSIGDILGAQGYSLEFMLGADVTWGNLGEYYSSHGDFKIFDFTYAKDHGYIPQDYNAWWGYEDDKLYAWAKDELTNLSQAGKPFYFVLENADTHFPDGFVSPHMKEKPFEQQYANVIHYSQQEVVKFVQWLKQQPFWDTTTVVITGDHLSMDTNFFKDWDPQYRRNVFNLILNSPVADPGPEITHLREFAPFDFFPTILTAMGAHIPGHRLGLGTDLYSGQKTLVERDGLATVNEELGKKSDFYTSFTPGAFS